MTMAVFTLLPDFLRSLGGGRLGYSSGRYDDALGPVDKFGVGGREVDHEVAVDGSGFDHDSGGEHVEDELGAVPAFRRVLPVMTSGPRDGGDGDVGGGGYRGVRDAGQGYGESVKFFRVS